MSDVIITLKIPESLAKEAESLGLLSNERLVTLLQTEVNRSSNNDVDEQTHQASVKYLREAADKLRALEPPLTLEEIEQWISEARHESSS